MSEKSDWRKDGVEYERNSQPHLLWCDLEVTGRKKRARINLVEEWAWS